MSEQVEDLVEKWRSEIEMTGFDREIAQRNQTLAKCADELEAVLNDE